MFYFSPKYSEPCSQVSCNPDTYLKCSMFSFFSSCVYIQWTCALGLDIAILTGWLHFDRYFLLFAWVGVGLFQLAALVSLVLVHGHLFKTRHNYSWLSVHHVTSKCLNI